MVPKIIFDDVCVLYCNASSCTAFSLLLLLGLGHLAVDYSSYAGISTVLRAGIIVLYGISSRLK